MRVTCENPLASYRNETVISASLYAKTREECEKKLAELIKTMKSEIAEMKKAAKNA